MGAAVLPDTPMVDYSTPGVENEGVSTGIAGILGTALVFAVGFGIIKLSAARRGRGYGPAESGGSG